MPTTRRLRSPVTFTEVAILTGFYLTILVVSLKLGYLVGMALVAVALALNFKVVFRLLRTYLWDQWRLINAETMRPQYLGPGRGGQAAAEPAETEPEAEPESEAELEPEAEVDGEAGAGASASKSKGKAKAKKKTGKRRSKDEAAKTAKAAKAARDGGKGKGKGRSKRKGETTAPGLGADPAPGWQLDWRPLVILVFAAVVLTVLEYYGSRTTYAEMSPKYFPHVEGRGFRELGVSVFGKEYQRLGEYVYWVGFRVGVFFVLPALFIVWLPSERLRDYGLSTRHFFKHLWIYGVLFLIVLPAVIMVSYTKDFASHYPFYKPWASGTFPRPLRWHDFLAWEAMYALQFFALEFFFRGFLLHALKRSIGAYSIFVMAVPYCMIHFGKPLPETLGAVAAGIVLGTLALRTGSIWAGVLIHVSVAWSMDWLALIQTGRLPTAW